ncbi:MAG: arginine repressor [Parabacteroides sp.]|nr:arginine repressor [Bacteroidaceae bacterium]
MKKKDDRQDAIKNLISFKEISSQKEIIDEMKRQGFKITQATLSRDFKQMKIAKAASYNGKYVYVLPNNIMYKRSQSNNSDESKENNGYKSIEFSGNIAVIRTRPAYAGSLAYDLDNRDFNEIIGTVAGDDTILLVLREGVSQKKILNLLSQMFNTK